MKPLSETLTEQGIAFTFPITIKDANGDRTYFEYRIGDYYKCEFDANRKQTYYETNDYCVKWEYDAEGNLTYYENSDGRKVGTPRSAKTCEGKVIEVDGIKYKLKAL